MSSTGQPTTILHVDDDPEFADLTAEFLEHEIDAFTVETATDVSSGLDRLAERSYDCIVSDYDMPEAHGIDFLKRVRADHGDLPFILFTGKGSEEIASEAISAGVTDYLEKGGNREQYELLANRIEHAVEQTRAQQRATRSAKRYSALFENLGDPAVEVTFDGDTAIIETINAAFEDVFGVEASRVVGDALDSHIVPEDDRDTARELNRVVREGDIAERELKRQTATGLRWFLLRTVPYTIDEERRAHAIYLDITDRRRQQQRFEAFLEHSTDVITVLDTDGTYRYQNPSSEAVIGYEPAELIGDSAFDYLHPDDRDEVIATFQDALEDPSSTPTVEYRFQHKDGSWRWLESIGNNQLDNPAIEGFVVNSRDITERKEYERELERKNERLEEFASLISHDLRNPLNVAQGHIELAKDECDSDHLEAAADGVDRSMALIDDLRTFAQEGQAALSEEVIDLSAFAETCWGTVETGAATLEVEADQSLRADPNRLTRLFENLFRNAIEHGGSEVQVTVGDLDDGFYVADDGPGIPPSEQDDVFKAGYSTLEDGTGFGLYIVREVAADHDWDLTITDSDAGGVRVELHDANRQED